MHTQLLPAPGRGVQVESWAQAPRGAAWMLPREHPGAIHGSQADPQLPPGVGCVGCMGCTPLAPLAAASTGAAAACAAPQGAERVCLNESELVHLNLTVE